jgi:surface antigen
MQGNGSSGFWFMALLGCCFLLLLGLMRNAEAAVHHVVSHRRSPHMVRPIRKLFFHPPRKTGVGDSASQDVSGHAVRYIRRPVPTALGRQDHIILRPRMTAWHRHGRASHDVSHSTYLWCVPYARRISHIDLIGDAFLWWAEASGRYARGARPAPGAVLAFHATAQMPLGHVAVVSRVVDSREILVDQANWVHNRISRNIRVVDISPDNNWTDVEVETTAGTLGVPYPTYGFIYDQSPDGMMIAKGNSTGTEVAEAPHIRKLTLVAPHRNLQ